MTTLLKCYQKQTKLEANCTNITGGRQTAVHKAKSEARKE